MSELAQLPDLQVPRSGFTLPVFACAAACAALDWLHTQTPCDAILVDLVNPPETAMIPIEQVAGLGPGMSLAITRSDPGANLDLTRHTPVWGLVQWGEASQEEQIRLLGGEGIGINQATGDAAIYHYAQTLIQHNLQLRLNPNEKIQVTIILPHGRTLATRTSNPAFGIVQGLSLLGTSGISQALSAPEQLAQFQAEIQTKAATQDLLVFCIGENGLDLARQAGIAPEQLVKTANWLGPLLVTAAEAGVMSLLLFGYHGKLIKLAGGIFHTHHHLADARQEILTAHCAQLGLTGPDLHHIFQAPTIEAATQYLKELEHTTGQAWIAPVFDQITRQIEARSQAYVFNHTGRTLQIGCTLFNRQRQVFASGPVGNTLWTALTLPSPSLG